MIKTHIQPRSQSDRHACTLIHGHPYRLTDRRTDRDTPWTSGRCASPGDTNTDRQTDGQTETHLGPAASVPVRGTPIQTDRQRDRQRHTLDQRPVCQSGGHPDRQTDRQTDRDTPWTSGQCASPEELQTDIQTDRRTDRHTPWTSGRCASPGDSAACCSVDAWPAWAAAYSDACRSVGPWSWSRACDT